MSISGRSVGLSKLYNERVATEAVHVVAQALSISEAEIMSRQRAKATIVFARQLSMYLSHVVGQLSLGQVSAEFGRDRTTVSYSCNMVEDRRDSPIFDDQIERMEILLKDRLTDMLTRRARDLSSDDFVRKLPASGGASI